MVRGGITTSLELEEGTADVDGSYAARRGQSALHHGVAISHSAVRALVLSDSAGAVAAPPRAVMPRSVRRQMPSSRPSSTIRTMGCVEVQSRLACCSRTPPMRQLLRAGEAEGRELLARHVAVGHLLPEGAAHRVGVRRHDAVVAHCADRAAHEHVQPGEDRRDYADDVLHRHRGERRVALGKPSA